MSTFVFRHLKNSNTHTAKILFLVPSPVGISPGQRFRFEQYLPYLQEKGITYSVKPFLTHQERRQLYKPKNVWGKVGAIMTALFRRIGLLFVIHRYNYVYIHRWAAIAGPPVFEWLVAKVYRKKIIYDFDDAIWVNESAYNKKYLAAKFLGKVATICGWAHKVSVGNDFLAAFAKKYNANVHIIPTVVDTNGTHGYVQEQVTNRPCIGWTGSFSTLLYLDKITPVLNKLQEKFDFDFFVIADKDPTLPVKNYYFLPWNKKTEVTDLLKFHIGIMPLTDDDITKGKCGFKAIQYMSVGIPAVVSNVGVNASIVDNGINGFVCTTEKEWEEAMTQLLTDTQLRINMGVQARKKMVAHYSVDSSKNNFLNLFLD
jgi:glycosyltransferase involved in cell wall biosynthesis